MVNASEMKQRMRRVFGDIQPTVLVRAPGRVNLIGEHTDYNDGYVLPIAMSQATWVLAAPAGDGRIEIHSTLVDETTCFSASDPGPPVERAWHNYVRGVAAMLLREGIRPAGCRLLIHSDVPSGGGVSSSAALEVGTARALLAMAGTSMDPVALALLARRAEHEYAGTPCGIMDQFICVLGKADHALLLDCRSQEFEQVPMPPGGVLVVMNTQVRHELGSSEYALRQAQCREGLDAIRRHHPEIASLRDATPAMLAAGRAGMSAVAFARCRHVIGEMERTRQAAEALRAGDLAAFGELMFASHASLRDDYQVSCPELDRLVEVAGALPGVYGARMTGGGFGGCAIALVKPEALEPLRRAITTQYDPHVARPAIVYTTRAADGATIEPLETRA